MSGLFSINAIVSEGFTLDIVRELAFISTDAGVTWRAEVSTPCNEMHP